MVDDLEVSKAGVEAEHDEQPVDATQRSDEPVSRTTKKFCAGVPIETWPRYDESRCCIKKPWLVKRM